MLAVFFRNCRSHAGPQNVTGLSGKIEHTSAQVLGRGDQGCGLCVAVVEAGCRLPHLPTAPCGESRRQSSRALMCTAPAQDSRMERGKLLPATGTLWPKSMLQGSYIEKNAIRGRFFPLAAQNLAISDGRGAVQTSRRSAPVQPSASVLTHGPQA